MSVNYRLNIKFEEEDLKTIYAAREKVIIVKHTEGDEGSHVSWVTFNPFENNTIDWTKDFAVYSSTSEVQNGARISKLSDKNANPSLLYTFKDAIFQNPIFDASLPVNTYAMQNLMEGTPALTFGLAQSVAVNGVAFPNNPVNAILVPYGHAASMTPIEKIDIFLKSDMYDSTVISHLSSSRLPVTYGEGESEHFVVYNGGTGEFYLKK